LHEHLVEHLNSEIVLETILDLPSALEWIKSTFLFIRVSKNPNHYGLTVWQDKTGFSQSPRRVSTRAARQPAACSPGEFVPPHFCSKFH
jgi:hypothetical protein